MDILAALLLAALIDTLVLMAPWAAMFLTGATGLAAETELVFLATLEPSMVGLAVVVTVNSDWDMLTLLRGWPRANECSFYLIIKILLLALSTRSRLFKT